MGNARKATGTVPAVRPTLQRFTVTVHNYGAVTVVASDAASARAHATAAVRQRRGATFAVLFTGTEVR